MTLAETLGTFCHTHTHTRSHAQLCSQERRECKEMVLCHDVNGVSLYFPGYLGLYVVYVIIVIISSFIYQRQKRLLHSSIEDTSVPGYSHKYTHRQPTKQRNKYLFFFAEFHSSDSSDDEVPCLFDGSIQQEYGRPTEFHIKMVRFMFYMMGTCVSDSEYRPLLPYTESTSQILLTSLNPVDSRKWRRKPWSWRVVKVLKV